MSARTAVQPKLKVHTQTMAYVLGIDAGATKTTAAIGDATHILSQGKSGPGNLHAASETTVSTHIIAAVRKAINLLDQPPEHFSHIVVGMAGIDSPQDQIKAERLIKKVMQPWSKRSTTLSVVNDIHIVRRSGGEAKYGVALIAGTGSHCFGINPAGDMAYAGGLEYILADEGSGYDMGLKALRAAVQSADGRTRHTVLQEAVLQHYKIKSIRALEPLVYHSEHFGKTEIGQLAKLVDVAAASGDWRALEIMDETIYALVQHVRAVVRRLHLQKSTFDLVVVGGLFDINAIPFLQRFERAIKKFAPKVHLVRPTQPPVWGAVRLAQDQL